MSTAASAARSGLERAAGPRAGRITSTTRCSTRQCRRRWHSGAGAETTRSGSTRLCLRTRSARMRLTAGRTLAPRILTSESRHKASVLSAGCARSRGAGCSHSALYVRTCHSTHQRATGARHERPARRAVRAQWTRDHSHTSLRSPQRISGAGMASCTTLVARGACERRLHKVGSWRLVMQRRSRSWTRKWVAWSRRCGGSEPTTRHCWCSSPTTAGSSATMVDGASTR